MINNCQFIKRKEEEELHFTFFVQPQMAAKAVKNNRRLMAAMGASALMKNTV